MTECKMCSNLVGQEDRDGYRKSKFCSMRCDVTYDKRKADARDAYLADMEEQNE